MDDLVVWLRAQLDQDERDAQDALKRTTNTRRWIGGKWVEDTVQPPEWRRSAWDPARVLREIDAKRRILATLYEEGGDRMFADIFRLLALPCADRPGYREEWRP